MKKKGTATLQMNSAFTKTEISTNSNFLRAVNKFTLKHCGCRTRQHFSYTPQNSWERGLLNFTTCFNTKCRNTSERRRVNRCHCYLERSERSVQMFRTDIERSRSFHRVTRSTTLVSPSHSETSILPNHRYFPTTVGRSRGTCTPAGDRGRSIDGAARRSYSTIGNSV